MTRNTLTKVEKLAGAIYTIDELTNSTGGFLHVQLHDGNIETPMLYNGFSEVSSFSDGLMDFAAHPLKHAYLDALSILWLEHDHGKRQKLLSAAQELAWFEQPEKVVGRLMYYKDLDHSKRKESV